MIDSKYIYRGQIIKDAVDEKICYADYADSGWVFWPTNILTNTSENSNSYRRSSDVSFVKTKVRNAFVLSINCVPTEATVRNLLLVFHVLRKCCMFLRISVASNKSRCLLPISGWSDRVREKLETGSNKLQQKQIFLRCILVG